MNINITRSGETRRVYRFEYALALVLFLTLALPLPLMLLRGFTNQPILEWRQGIPAGGTDAPIQSADWYHRWGRKAKLVSGKATEFQEAFARSFGGRMLLRKEHAWLMVDVFGVSPAPEVVIGKSGWLFVANEQALDGYRGIRPFTDDELEHLRRPLVERQAKLEKQGIPFLVVLPPDKQTVYPELMPERYTRIGPSRLEQTVAYLRQHPGVDFVDLRPALETAKRERPGKPLYLLLDTHWSVYGSYFGYRAVAEKLKERFPHLRPWERSELDESEFVRPVGDLTVIAGREEVTEKEGILSPHALPQNLPESAAWGYAPKYMRPDKMVITEYPTGEIPRAVIFHDSYMQGMSLYLTRHFRRAVWVWGKYDPAIVAKEKPDIVIQERVERLLHYWAGREQ